MIKEEDIDQDVEELLAKLENLRYEDKKKLLVSLLSKYMTKARDQVSIDYNDLQIVIDNAKGIFLNVPTPCYLEDNRGSARELDDNDIVKMCLMEATFWLLNKKQVLTKIPNFKNGGNNGKR